MSCAIVSGYSLDCKDAAGGIKKIYITELANISAVNENASGFVTGITMAATKKFYAYELWPQHPNDFNFPIQTDPSKGTVSYQHLLTVTFSKMGYDLQAKLSSIIKNRTAVIVQTQNDQYFLLGRRNGMEVSGGKGEAGIKMNDFQGYTLPMSGMEIDFPNEVSSSIIAGLL